MQEVKSRLSIEDVVAEYVQLKRAGRNFKGLSPFTNERTPSFVVSPEKQIWHDFSSGRGGDMFTFIQEVEGVDFKGALELLARKAGVDIEKYQTSKGARGPAKERLFELLDTAAKFYQVQFSANPDAYNYILGKRKYKKETVLEFRIGYSPDSDRSLTDYLLKKDFSEEELKAAGVSTQRRGGIGDMFRGRIMVPLMDSFGKVIGFTARLLYDVEGAPKYINTPSTVLYDKSRHIYGLHLAKKTIKSEDASVLVEGNLDVIASHQAGVTNVVATAGTALTEFQLKALSRLSSNVRAAFDQDRAGIAATERAIPIASKVGVELSVIDIPSGKDPDELIQQDPKLWQEAITKFKPALDWLLDVYEKRLDLGTASGKREFTDVALEVVRSLDDEVVQDHYIQKIAKMVDVSSDSLRAKLHKVADTQKPLKHVRKSEAPEEIMNPEVRRAGERLLGLTLMLPGTRGYLDILTEDMFDDDRARQTLTFLKNNLDFDGNLAGAPELQLILDYVKILSLQFEELYGEIDTLELQYEAARLRAKVIDHYVKQQKKILSHKLSDSSDAETSKLLRTVRELDQLLKRTKE